MKIRILFLLLILINFNTDLIANKELIEAAINSNLDELKELIKSNININYKDQYGNTALMYAVKNGDIDIVNYLLLKGADPNIINNLQQTSLILAVDRDNLSNILDKSYSSKELELLFKSDNNYPIVRSLLIKGANPNLRDYLGRTPLYLAAEYGDLRCLNLLLGVHSVDVNIKDIFGYTPLMAACRTNQKNIVKILVKHPNIKLNAQSTGLTSLSNSNNLNEGTGLTALMVAASMNRATIVKMLLRAGADYKITDYNGRNALDIAKGTYNSSKRLLEALNSHINLKS